MQVGNYGSELIPVYVIGVGTNFWGWGRNLFTTKSLGKARGCKFKFSLHVMALILKKNVNPNLSVFK